MPHPDREHSLMIEVARLRAENERLGSACVAWGARVDELDAALAAANARADAAEAGLFETKLALSRMAAGTVKDQEALAAARRECDEFRAILLALQDAPMPPHVAQRFRKALGAPAAAAGEEK